uniref:Uncharacterized protein n=1 Tax=Peronospora matthiolae TaxID=2874970 RepID=A0AAV1ULJ1_9STRA
MTCTTQRGSYRLDRPTDRPIKRQTNSTHKDHRSLAITALATVASVASANDYQPALRALAAQEPTAPITVHTCFPTRPSNYPPPVEAAAAAANTEPDVDDDSKKVKEWVGDDWDGDIAGGGYGWGASLGWMRWWLGWMQWRLGMVDVTHQTTPSTRLQPAALLTRTEQNKATAM